MKTSNHFYINPGEIYRGLERDLQYTRVYPRQESAEGAVLVSRKNLSPSEEIFVIFDQANGGNQTHRYVFIYETFEEAVEKVRSLRHLRKNNPSIIKTSGVIRMWIHR